MNSSRLGTATVERIIQEYQNAAAAHGRAILRGDHVEANKNYETVAMFSNELKKRGPEAQRSLLSLLLNPDPEIRFCAAMDALDFAPELGEAELKKLAESNEICGLNAYAILKERGKADIEFPRKNK